MPSIDFATSQWKVESSPEKYLIGHYSIFRSINNTSKQITRGNTTSAALTDCASQQKIINLLNVTSIGLAEKKQPSLRLAGKKQQPRQAMHQEAFFLGWALGEFHSWFGWAMGIGNAFNSPSKEKQEAWMDIKEKISEKIKPGKPVNTNISRFNCTFIFTYTVAEETKPVITSKRVSFLH